MRPRDLVADPDGTLSSTKVWLAVGYSAMTWAFLNHSVRHPLDWELLAAYGGIVTGNNFGVRWLKEKSRARRPD